VRERERERELNRSPSHRAASRRPLCYPPSLAISKTTRGFKCNGRAGVSPLGFAQGRPRHEQARDGLIFHEHTQQAAGREALPSNAAAAGKQCGFS
jgi:hypothetical protein